MPSLAFKQRVGSRGIKENNGKDTIQIQRGERGNIERPRKTSDKLESKQEKISETKAAATVPSQASNKYLRETFIILSTNRILMDLKECVSTEHYRLITSPELGLTHTQTDRKTKTLKYMQTRYSIQHAYKYA